MSYNIPSYNMAFTVREFLNNTSGIKFNRSDVRNKLNDYAKFDVPESLCGHVIKLLRKHNSKEKLLNSKIHAIFLDTVREPVEYGKYLGKNSKDIQDKTVSCDKCEQKFVNITNLNIHINDIHKEIDKNMKDIQCEMVSCDDCEKTFFNVINLHNHIKTLHQSSSVVEKQNYIKRKTYKNLTRTGKYYRNKNCIKYINKIDKEERQDVLRQTFRKNKDVINVAKAINMTFESDLSRRGYRTIRKVICSESGLRLPSENLIVDKKIETYPQNIYSDEKGASVPLQDALEKKVERLLKSPLLSNSKRKSIISYGCVNMIFKVGGDAQTGFNIGHRKTSRGNSIYCQSIVPLKLYNDTNIYWKIKQSNSKIYSCFKKRIWEKETNEEIVKQYSELEDEISNLKPFILNMCGKNVKVNLVCHNSMNDGKTLNAISLKVHKSKGRVPNTALAISTQACHLCLQTSKDNIKKFEVDDNKIEQTLINKGACPLHTVMRVREHLINTCVRKKCSQSESNSQLVSDIKKHRKSLFQQIRKQICVELHNVCGANLFMPTPSGGNTNAGEPLRRVTKHSDKSAPILGCSKDLIDILHIICSKFESTKFQNLSEIEHICRQAYHMWKREFGVYATISPSLHRLLQHSVLYMNYFQKIGFSVGEMSEQVQEASNFDSARDNREHSYRGDNKISNLNVFQRSWARSDFHIIYYKD